MFRVPLWLSLILLLAQCSSEKAPATAPPCTYKSTPQRSLKMSTFPQKVGLPFDQKKLIDLMWVSVDQSECFVRKNGNVQLFKAPSQSKSSTLFSHLKSAPPAAIKNWNKHIEILSSKRNGKPSQLLGLTTLYFTSTPSEKIARTEILILPEARSWHLWHEYAHYLIGVSRTNSKSMNLKERPLEDVEIALLQIGKKKKTKDFEKYFKSLANKQIEFLQKAFVDEVLIELTLIDITSQAFDLLPVSYEDLEDAERHIQNHFEEYLVFYDRFVSDLQTLAASASLEQQALIELHLKSLEKDKDNLESNIYHY
jgi:hypothetical protein